MILQVEASLELKKREVSRPFIIPWWMIQPLPHQRRRWQLGYPEKMTWGNRAPGCLGLKGDCTPVKINIAGWNMAPEWRYICICIYSLHKMRIFHCHVSLQEGILPSYVGIIQNREIRIPYETTRIQWKVRPFFFTVFCLLRGFVVVIVDGW